MYDELWLSGFLYDLYRFDYRESFSRHMLKVLMKHFGFRNIGFLRPVCDIPNNMDAGHGSAVIEIIEDIVGFEFFPILQSRYNALYAVRDEMSYIRRCKDLSTNCTISSKQIYDFDVMGEYKEFTDFLDSVGIKYFLTLYLFAREGAYIGRLGINNTEADGDFSQEALNALNQTAKHIAQAYVNATSHTQATHKLKLLEIETSALPVGMITFDRYFEICDMNHAAVSYCKEILDTLEVDTRHVGAEFRRLLISRISQADLGLNGRVCINFHGATHLYSCTLTPCILSGQLDKNEVFYFLYINRETGSQMRGISAFCNQHGLTNQERNVAALIEQGCSNQEISQKLMVSSHTVKSHVSSIFRKVGASSRMMLLQKMTAHYRGSAF